MQVLNKYKMNEIEKFDLLAKEWWDADGKLSALHKFNKVRIPYIIDKIGNNKNLSILDVGCGGGLVTESLYGAGFTNITGIDLAPNSIEIAKQHAGDKKIIYKNIDIADVKEKFDVILCLEVLEHIDDFGGMIKNIFNTTSDDGLIIFSTINKTYKAFFESIIAPEYIINMVEKSTHHFEKLIKPEQILQNIPDKSYKIIETMGVSYNLINNKFYMKKNTDANYFIILKKIVAIK